jgi:hypothetical protein
MGVAVKNQQIRSMIPPNFLNAKLEEKKSFRKVEITLFTRLLSLYFLYHPLLHYDPFQPPFASFPSPLHFLSMLRHKLAQKA